LAHSVAERQRNRGGGHKLACFVAERESGREADRREERWERRGNGIYKEKMKRISFRLLAAVVVVTMIAVGCVETPEPTPVETDPTEQPEGPTDPIDNPDDPDTPGPDNPDNPDPDNPDNPDPDNPDPNNPDPDNPDNPDPENPDPNNPDPDNPDPDNPDPNNPDPDQPDPEQPGVTVEVLDPGATRTETTVTPQHPDEIHEVQYNDFYNTVQDELDEYGNVDYVIAQGNGTAWPLLLENGHIRFYQGNTKGGGYIRVRSHNGAKILCVKVGSATNTKIAHSLNGKAAKSATVDVAAGSLYTVDELTNCTEVKFYCMGTTQSERWEMDSIYVKYQGGFVESDYYVEEKEYGPLVKVTYPFTENFEEEFPTTDKPSYYKYGLTAGRDNLQWSTWFGSFSWQNPIEGSQSAQLRIYQEDTEYDQEQFGHLKMEYFLKDLSKVSFKYYYSEFWNKATISYCEFGSTEWHNPQQIALSSYSDRQTVQDFTYTLDNGNKHDAKIRIEIDEATGFPSKDHYDFIFDSFVFE